MRSVQVLGLCYEGCDNRVPGAATAPSLIRWGLEGAEYYSLLQHQALPPLQDHGDRPFFDFSPEHAVEAMAAVLSDRLDPNQPFLVLGGDHLITLAVLRWLTNQPHQHPWLLHLDAHADRRDTHEGHRLSHATVIRRVEELLGAPRVLSFGIRAQAPEETWEAQRVHTFEVLEPLTRFLEQVGPDEPIYLSFDLDVLDPGIMPAVSNPEPGGIGINEAAAVFQRLSGHLVGADLVELVPTATFPHPAAQHAGSIYRELLIALGVEKSSRLMGSS